MSQPAKIMLRPVYLWSGLLLVMAVGLVVAWSLGAVPGASSRSKATLLPFGHMYATWAGFEADRYMAAWLIKRFIDPEAEFSFLPIGSEVPADGSIAFDMPGGRWFRGGRQSTAELILHDIGAEDPALDSMVGMVRKLEMAYWLVDPMSDAGRMKSQILRIIDGTPDSEERLNKVLGYFDGVYAAGGQVPK